MEKKKKGGKRRVNGIPLDGDAVARRRVEKGFTQEALADLVGVDTKTIHRAEAGEATRFYEEIAEALGVSLLHLLKHSPEALEPPPASMAKERMRFSVIIDAPPPELVEAFKHEPLAGKLWLFCQLQAAIRDGAPGIGLEFSSVVVSADLTKADALRMTKAYLGGELACLGITKISVQGITTQRVAAQETATRQALVQKIASPHVSDLERLIFALVLKLPDRLQVILHMTLNDVPIGKIAEELGLSIHAVRRKRQLALNIFHDLLQTNQLSRSQSDDILKKEWPDLKSSSTYKTNK